MGWPFLVTKAAGVYSKWSELILKERTEGISGGKQHYLQD